VRDLLVGPRRYSDLLAELPGIPTNVPASHQAGNTGNEGARKVLVVTKASYSIPPEPIEFRRPLDTPIAWLGETRATPLAGLPAGPVVERARNSPPRSRASEPPPRPATLPASRSTTSLAATASPFVTLRRARAVIGVSTYRSEEGKWTRSLPEPDRMPSRTPPESTGYLTTHGQVPGRPLPRLCLLSLRPILAPDPGVVARERYPCRSMHSWKT
jgi:hypothetical protein